MRTDLIGNLEMIVARAPAALSAGANLTSYLDVRNISRPMTALISVAALGGGSADVTVKCADDASGTNTVDLAAAALRFTEGADGTIDTDDEVLLVEFEATKPFVAIDLNATGTTGVAGIILTGVRLRP